MVTMDHIVRKNERYCERVIGDEIIFLSEKGDELHAINDVGCSIWGKIDGKRTLGQIHEMICEEYEVEKKKAAADLISFIDDLAERNIVLI